MEACGDLVRPARTLRRADLRPAEPGEDVFGLGAVDPRARDERQGGYEWSEGSALPPRAHRDQFDVSQGRSAARCERTSPLKSWAKKAAEGDPTLLSTQWTLP